MTEPITLAPTPPHAGRTSATRNGDAAPAALDVAILVGLALISYVPMFLTQPGKVAADTKQYLYLDPGRLIQSAISMWDPDVGAGTVTHQNIGFLFPMGPYYWLVAELHIPVWVGQRFWMGSLFFAAGTGVWYLGRVMGLSRSGRLAAALAYMLTPFVIDYIARISAIVMPWAALGWMLAFTILAVRRGGWRYPALFAVVIALVGGVNATSILLVGLAPLLWLIYAVWGTREVTFRGRRCSGAAHRRAHPRGLAVVDRRALGRRRLRHQHPQVHRDDSHRLVDVALVRGPARARLLVLLRSGQAGPLDRGVDRLSPVDLADRGQLSPPDPRPGRGSGDSAGATGASPSP